MAQLDHNVAVLHMPGEYLVSADLSVGQSVTFESRAGESGEWREVSAGGVALTLTNADKTQRIAIGAGDYLRAICSPTTVVARSSEVNPAI